MKRENHNIVKMKSLIIGILVIISACTPKQTESVSPVVIDTELTPKTQILVIKPKQPDFNKILREAIYFSSSLEREALKLILNNNSLQKQSLFSVLSYIVEINTGAKKSTPFGLDCGKFEVRREQKVIKIFKSCVKPIVEVAKINIISEDSIYDVEFMIKEWANVVGLPVALTSDNIRCQLAVKNQKLYRLNCNDWSYLTEESQASSTVIKAKYFLFQRDAQKQFVIKGGFFKELIENKKVDIVVPLEGKIKIIEKEIKVIDDFAKIIQQDIESGKKNEEKEEPKKETSNEISKETGQENSEKSNQKNNQEDQQEISQQSGQEGGQEIPVEEIQQEAQPQENHQEISHDATPAISPQDGEPRRRGR